MRIDFDHTPAPAMPHARSRWRALVTQVLRLAGAQAELLSHAERPWASATFAGTRHAVTLEFRGADGLAAGEAFIAALPEHEFAVPGQIVADATIGAVTHATLPAARLTVEAELLLVEDAE